MQPYQTAQKESSDFEILLKYIYREFLIFKKVLKSHYKFILFFGIINSIGMGYYIFQTKGTYNSTTRFFLNSDPLSTGNNFNSISAVTNLLGIGDALNTVSERSRQTFFSESILKKVLFNEVIINQKKDLLINHLIYLEDLRHEWDESSTITLPNLSKYYLKLGDIDPRNPYAALQVRLVLNYILDPKHLFYGVGIDIKSGVITVAVNHFNQEFSLLFNEILNREFIDFNNQIILGLGKKNQNFMKFKVDSLQSRIQFLSKQLANVQDQNKFLFFESDKQQVKELTTQIEQNSFLYVEAKKNYEVLELLNNNLKPAVTYISKPFYPLNYSKRSIFKYGFFGLIFGLVISYLFFRLKLLFGGPFLQWQKLNFPGENTHR